MSKVLGVVLVCWMVVIPVSADGFLPSPTGMVEWVAEWFGKLMGPHAEPGGDKMGPHIEPGGQMGPTMEPGG